MARGSIRALRLALALLASLVVAGCAPLPEAAEPPGAKIFETYWWRLGDDPAFATAEDGWIEGSADRRAFDHWQGLAWFRFVLDVGPERAGTPIALRLDHRGPIEVYFDGRLVERRGVPSRSPEGETPYISSRADWLQVVPDEAGRHDVMIRYSAHFLEHWRWSGRTPLLAASSADPDEAHARSLRWTELLTTHRMMIGAASIAFALPFLAIFGLLRRVDFSTWYAVLCLTVAANVWFLFPPASSDPSAALRAVALWSLSFVGLAYAMPRLVAVRHSRPSWTVRLLGVAGLALALYALLQPYRATNLLMVYMLWAYVEVALSIVRARRERSEELEAEPTAETQLPAAELNPSSLHATRLQGRDSWLILVGSLPIIATGLVAVLQSLGLAPELFEFPVFPAPFYASLVLMAAMAGYLALDFVRTQRDLEEQLVRVRQLSDEALAQERRAREREVQRARLEAEHDRKTAELEEARALQLSMLPDELPAPPGVELAVVTRTATEVGGDYYDAVLEPDGSLLLAIGDAAGHGVQAGTVVAATKSLVQASVGTHEAPAMRLERMASALRRSGLRRRHMALMLGRLERHGEMHALDVAGAAMPPVYVIRRGLADRGAGSTAVTLETIELPGLPLGSFGSGPYARATIELRPGDAILCVSDGMIEARAADGALLGFEGFARLVEDVAAETFAPAEILEQLRAAIDEFTGGEEPDDDRTALLLRIEPAR